MMCELHLCNMYIAHYDNLSTHCSGQIYPLLVKYNYYTCIIDTAESVANTLYTTHSPQDRTQLLADVRSFLTNPLLPQEEEFFRFSVFVCTTRSHCSSLM
jgi:hypothetical protein